MDIGNRLKPGDAVTIKDGKDTNGVVIDNNFMGIAVLVTTDAGGQYLYAKHMLEIADETP